MCRVRKVRNGGGGGGQGLHADIRFSLRKSEGARHILNNNFSCA